MSRRLEFLYDINLQFECPVKGHSFCLRCLPQEFSGQVIADVSFSVSPNARCSYQRDSFGNLLQYGRIDEQHNSFHYTVMGTAVLDQSLYDPGKNMPCYKYESPLTEMTSEMKSFADRFRLPDNGIEKAFYIMEQIRRHMKYVPGTTGTWTSAGDAFAVGSGVCQDYAHVYIAFARAAGIPARYVNGLTEGDSASHAWCELLIDEQWVGVDPTRGRFTDEGYIVFNRGRDFHDCPIERGVFLGITAQSQQIKVQVNQ